MKKTFTLIEMLIVIVIIGVLAAALVPRLISVQERARDAKRQTDSNQIYNGLTIYYADNGYLLQTTTYGEYNRNGRDQSSVSGFLQFLVSGNIMSSIPLDPINDAISSYAYSYVYYCYANIGFSLGYVPEKTDASVRNLGITTGSMDSSISKCQ